MRGQHLALLAALLVTGCQEKLTAPAECPALCPGGSSQVFDEVINPITGADSSFRGYTQPYSSSSLLVVGPKVRPVDLGRRGTFADVGQTVAEFLGVPALAAGTSFLSEVWLD